MNNLNDQIQFYSVNSVSEILPYDYHQPTFQQSSLRKLWEAISSLRILIYADVEIIDLFLVHQRLTDESSNMTTDRIYLSTQGIEDFPVGLQNLLFDVRWDPTTPPNLSVWCNNFLNQHEPLTHLIVSFFEIFAAENLEGVLPIYNTARMWMNPMSNTQAGYRTFNPHNQADIITICNELNKFIWLHYYYPRFFTDVPLITCDNYAVPIHPSHGLNITLFDNVIQNDLFLLIKVIFDVLVLIFILSCNGWAFSVPFSLHEISYLNNVNIPSVHIRNPEIINQGGNNRIQENIQQIFRICSFSFPYLQHLFQPLQEAWQSHQNLNRLILEFYSVTCRTYNIQNLPLESLLENQSSKLLFFPVPFFDSISFSPSLSDTFGSPRNEFGRGYCTTARATINIYTRHKFILAR